MEYMEQAKAVCHFLLTTGGKLFFFLLLLRCANWKIACFFWLGSSVVGSATIVLYMWEATKFVLVHVCNDNWYSNLAILSVWLLHECNLISVPRIWAYCCGSVSKYTHYVLDVTGDGKFDYEDVAYLAGNVASKVRRSLQSPDADQRQADAAPAESPDASTPAVGSSPTNTMGIPLAAKPSYPMRSPTGATGLTTRARK
jgi:hypothetical protein